MSYLRELEKSQHLNKSQIYELQSEKLRNLVAFAYENVPYYKKLFKLKGIGCEDIRSPSDLYRLPFLTKEIIRKEIETLKSKRAKNLQKSNTGGSTGSPMIFYIGKKRISYDVAAKLRATRWWGVDIGDPEIVVWGSPVELTKQDRIRQFRDRIFRTKLLSAFDMTEEIMLEYLHLIKEFRPLHIFGYPSSIYILSKYAKKKNIRLDNIGVKVVFCTAEKLYDHQKSLISEVFNTRIANGYGGRDSGFIAHECPEALGMHITAESIIVEIVDNTGNPLPPGQKGEIVVTHLDTHDFPFIRYKTGDIGILSKEACPCGRGLPVLKKIKGRTTDFIITPDGTIMHGLSLIYVLREIPGIREFKIIQEKPNRFLVNIVKNSIFRADSEAVIRDGFKKRIGVDAKIVFNYPPKIEVDRSGKFRYVVSNVHYPSINVR
jgi:phenylacetate-CoA ligase